MAYRGTKTYVQNAEKNVVDATEKAMEEEERRINRKCRLALIQNLHRKILRSATAPVRFNLDDRLERARKETLYNERQANLCAELEDSDSEKTQDANCARRAQSVRHLGRIRRVLKFFQEVVGRAAMAELWELATLPEWLEQQPVMRKTGSEFLDSMEARMEWKRLKMHGDVLKYMREWNFSDVKEILLSPEEPTVPDPAPADGGPGPTVAGPGPTARRLQDMVGALVLVTREYAREVGGGKGLYWD